MHTAFHNLFWIFLVSALLQLSVYFIGAIGALSSVCVMEHPSLFDALMLLSLVGRIQAEGPKQVRPGNKTQLGNFILVKHSGEVDQSGTC